MKIVAGNNIPSKAINGRVGPSANALLTAVFVVGFVFCPMCIVQWLSSRHPYVITFGCKVIGTNPSGPPNLVYKVDLYIT